MFYNRKMMCATPTKQINQNSTVFCPVIVLSVLSFVYAFDYS